MDPEPVRGTLSHIHYHFKHIQSSLSNLSVLLNVIKKYSIDRIFHLGGMLSLPLEENPWAAFDVNVVGTYNVLEASIIKGVKQLIYGSTIATYSKDIPSDFIDERTIQRPITMYGATKVFGELLGR